MLIEVVKCFFQINKIYHRIKTMNQTRYKNSKLAEIMTRFVPIVVRPLARCFSGGWRPWDGCRGDRWMMRIHPANLDEVLFVIWLAKPQKSTVTHGEWQSNYPCII